MRAEISFQNVLGNLALDMRVGKNGQPFGYGAQLRNLGFGEAARPIGRIAHHVGAVGTRHRKAEVFGTALRLDVVENRKIEPGVGSVQTAADGFAAIAYARHQVFLVGHDIDDFVHHHDFLCLRGGAPPDIS